MAGSTKGQAVEAPALIGAEDETETVRVLTNDPVATSSDEAARLNDYNAMVRHLKAQPKVRIRTPKDGCTVIINGWRWDMPGNQRLEVPEQVAELLEEGGYI